MLPAKKPAKKPADSEKCEPKISGMICQQFGRNQNRITKNGRISGQPELDIRYIPSPWKLLEVVLQNGMWTTIIPTQLWHCWLGVLTGRASCKNLARISNDQSIGISNRRMTWLMTRVAVTTTSMRLPHAVVSSQPASTTDFIDAGAFTSNPYIIYTLLYQHQKWRSQTGWYRNKNKI